MSLLWALSLISTTYKIFTYIRWDCFLYDNFLIHLISISISMLFYLYIFQFKQWRKFLLFVTALDIFIVMTVIMLAFKSYVFEWRFSCCCCCLCNVWRHNAKHKHLNWIQRIIETECSSQHLQTTRSKQNNFSTFLQRNMRVVNLRNFISYVTVTVCVAITVLILYIWILINEIRFISIAFCHYSKIYSATFLLWKVTHWMRFVYKFYRLWNGNWFKFQNIFIRNWSFSRLTIFMLLIMNLSTLYFCCTCSQEDRQCIFCVCFLK